MPGKECRINAERVSARRGAALILALAALALVATLLAVGGARVQGLNAEQGRVNRQARLHAAVWDAAWSRLLSASRTADGLPVSALRETPDGVKTSVSVQRMSGTRRGEQLRFSLSTTVEFERARREAWSLVQRNESGDYRILTWVER